MGYAELIEESSQDDAVRRNAAVIHSESQRMKQTIESLSHFSRVLPESQTPFSIEQMLKDIWRLRQPELERAGIALELSIPQSLPRLRANVEQMRQVILQILSNRRRLCRALPPGGRGGFASMAALIKDRVQVLDLRHRAGLFESGPGVRSLFHDQEAGRGAGSRSDAVLLDRSRTRGRHFGLQPAAPRSGGGDRAAGDRSSGRGRGCARSIHPVRILCRLSRDQSASKAQVISRRGLTRFSRGLGRSAKCRTMNDGLQDAG